MQIRKMKPGDYEEVYRLWTSTPGMGLNDLDDSRAGIEKYLMRNPNTCFVALDEDKISGVILSGHDGRRGTIHHLAVVMDKRKRGIGSALLESAAAALGEEGISKITLVVFRKNETGNRFWEKHGFTVREDLIYRNKAIREMNRIDT